jgi:hypothetical protein
VGPLDQDSIDDVVTVGGPVSVFRGASDGIPVLESQIQTYPGQVDHPPIGADFNGDGLMDLSLPGRDGAWFLLGSDIGSLAPDLTLLGNGQDSWAVSEDFDEDGHPDIAFQRQVFFNRTFRHLDSRRENVNTAQGPVADVLFVNGSSGEGLARTVLLSRSEPVSVSVGVPPSMVPGEAPFVMYVALSGPRPSSPRELPFGIGTLLLPSPLSGEMSPRQANNIGVPRVLGRENWPQPSTPAPSLLLSLPNGIRRELTFYLQGLIMDSASPNGTVAVTNGVVVCSS